MNSVESICRTPRVVQWLRLHTPNAGGLGSIPAQGTRAHRTQLRSKISRATAKTWHDQIHFNRSKCLVSEGWLGLQSGGTQSGLCSLGLPSFSHHARIMFFTDISDSQISLIFSISLGSWDRPSISLF